MLFDCNGRQIEDSMKTEFRINLPSGEVVYTEPGKYGPGDMLIFSGFPDNPHPHTLKYIGAAVRLKGLVEDRRYLYTGKGKGRAYLMDYLHHCLFPGSDVASTNIGIIENIYDEHFK